MSLIPGIESSGSALHAERIRMNVIANNIANVNTTHDAQGNVFHRQLVLFENALSEEATPGSPGSTSETSTVKIREITDDTRPLKNVYMPGHPNADAQGMVKMPNVNVTEEMVDMITASRSIEANVQVITTAKQMVQRILDIGRR